MLLVVAALDLTHGGLPEGVSDGAVVDVVEDGVRGEAIEGA